MHVPYDRKINIERIALILRVYFAILGTSKALES